MVSGSFLHAGKNRVNLSVIFCALSKVFQGLSVGGFLQMFYAKKKLEYYLFKVTVPYILVGTKSSKEDPTFVVVEIPSYTPYYLHHMPALLSYSPGFLSAFQYDYAECGPF
jgi:hypothetical protein